jgi:putative sterol carrier protein
MTTWKFLSPEWIAEVQRVVHETIKPEDVNYASTTVLTIFENCPPDMADKALLTRVEKGVFSQIVLQPQPYPQTEFVISGDYKSYLKVFKGQIEPSAALMTGELHLQGNIFKAMGMVNVLAPFYTALGRIPAEFG